MATTTHSEIYVSAAALVVVLIKNGYLDEAEEFIEWFLDNFETDLSHLLPGE